MSDRPTSPTPATERNSSFIEVLWELYQHRETGVLEVLEEQVRTIIYFRGGVPVSVGGGHHGQALGRVLLDHGALDEQQHHAIMSEMAVRLAEDEAVRFGEVGVSLGLLRPEQIDHALAEQVRQRVMHCVQWLEPQCEFSRSEESLAGIVEYPCAVERLICEGVRGYYDSARLDALLLDAEPLYVALTVDAAELATRFSLSPPEEQFLAGLDGQHVLDEALCDAEIDVEQAQQLIVVLLTTGYLQLSTEPASEPPQALIRSDSDVPTAFPPAAPLHEGPRTPDQPEAPVTDELEAPVPDELEAPVTDELEALVTAKLDAPVTHEPEAPVTDEREDWIAAVEEDLEPLPEPPTEPSPSEQEPAATTTEFDDFGTLDFDLALSPRLPGEPLASLDLEPADDAVVQHDASARTPAPEAFPSLPPVPDALPAPQPEPEPPPSPPPADDLGELELPLVGAAPNIPEAALAPAPKKRLRPAGAAPRVTVVQAAFADPPNALSQLIERAVQPAASRGARSAGSPPTTTKQQAARPPQRGSTATAAAQGSGPQAPAATVDTALAGLVAVDLPQGPPRTVSIVPSKPGPHSPAPTRDVKRDRLTAEMAFRKGSQLLMRGQHQQAVEPLRQAHELHPEATDYELHLAWAELCVTSAINKAADLRHRLTVLSGTVLREDRSCAFAHYVTGQLAMARGDHAIAMKAFKRAVDLDPSNDDAQRHYVVARRRVGG